MALYWVGQVARAGVTSAARRFTRHGERSAAIHDCEFGALDCRASLAETKLLRSQRRVECVRVVTDQVNAARSFAHEFRRRGWLPYGCWRTSARPSNQPLALR